MKQFARPVMKLSAVQRPKQNLTAPHSISPACWACVWGRTWGQEWSSLFPSGYIWLFQPPMGVEWLTSPTHFLNCLPSRDSLPTWCNSFTKAGKRKACMMPVYLKSKSTPPSPSTCRGSSQAGSAHPRCLALPTCTWRKHWHFLPGLGNFAIDSSAEDATVAFIHQTHEESW